MCGVLELREEQIQELVEYVMGTPHTLDEGLESLGFDPEDIDRLGPLTTSRIDERVFWCSRCGWCLDAGERYEADDYSGEEICDDCAEES